MRCVESAVWFRSVQCAELSGVRQFGCHQLLTVKSDTTADEELVGCGKVVELSSQRRSVLLQNNKQTCWYRTFIGSCSKQFLLTLADRNAAVPPHDS
jgi:hypothetical protein